MNRNAARSLLLLPARRTLARLPTTYSAGRLPKCPRPSCVKRQKRRGVEQRYYVDKYRMNVERSYLMNPPCYCGEYQGRTGNMPHRIRSGWCQHNPNITDADRKDRWEGGTRK